MRPPRQATDPVPGGAPGDAPEPAPDVPVTPPPARPFPPERRRDEQDPNAVGFVLRLGQALHRHGHSAQRLEDILGATSDRLGLPGSQFFSTPTSMMASFGPIGRHRTHMLRIEPGEVDLAKLADLEHVSIDVAQGRMSPEEGSAEIERVVAAPSPYGRTLTALAYGLTSGAACQFVGGGAEEMAVSTVLGLAVGGLALVAERHRRLGRVFEPLAAFFVSLATIAFAHVAGPLAVLVATIGGLIVLLPGLTLTTAITELATRNLASGTARLSGAFMTFLGIAFGVALGNRLGAAAFGVPVQAAPLPLPGWAALATIVVAALGFTVILRAHPRDAPWIVAAGALAVVAGRLGTAHLGRELGAFLGALAVALASSGYERWRHRPAAVVLVPGILMLVPGSVGFRSLVSMMEQRAVAGIETAFSMFLTAVALVAGLLIANVIAPEPLIRETSRRYREAHRGLTATSGTRGRRGRA